MENTMITAEGKEIGSKGLCEIAAEIKTITNQMRVTLISGIIEIGKRFEQAKELVEYGKWGEFCENVTGYSQSMAENYIKIYHEYGDEQYSLWGDLSNSQSLGNLGVTKLIALTAIPADEREAFVENNNITEETTVKELQAKIREVTQVAAETEDKYEQELAKMRIELQAVKSELSERETELEDLQGQLSNIPDTAPTDDMQKMIADAQAEERDKLQKEIEAAENKQKKALDKLQKLQDKYDKLKDEAEEKDNAIKTAEEKTAELKAELDKIKKTSDLSAQEGIVKLNLCFEEAQDNLKKIADAIKAVSDDKRDKLRGAIVDTLKGLLEQI